MKHIIISLALTVALISCKNDTERVVSPVFTDSLITHYTLPATVKSTDEEMQFWKNRINPQVNGLVNETKYAGTLMRRYHLLGDIEDVREADSVVRRVDTAFNQKEAAVALSLVAHSILQHRFKAADQYLQRAKQIGLKRYESFAGSFDVDFELGRYSNAALELKLMKPAADYGYYFRQSKMEHFNGAIDSAIQSMLKAAALSEGVDYLRQVALSNAADLCIHAGELQQANALYEECIRISSADFHSIMGLGWIALVHDKNDSLAERLFLLALAHTKLPDPLFKLAQMAEAQGDSALELSYARRFEALVTDTVYGNMYNKYLIELYTGILNEPAKALALASREINGRATPQTYAWYAWCLVADNKKEEAYKVFEQFVSGKPLEGLELYWMGKLMQRLGKGYNAQEFYKAAYKNKYDLSPAMIKDLEKNLEE